MSVRTTLPAGAFLIGLCLVVVGCSDVNQFDQEKLWDFRTLTVAYGDPGPNPDPCNDFLPKIDGLAEDREWNSAEPLFVQMSGADGNGGQDFFLELRAIWTNEADKGGTDRIYFLIRYPDDDLDVQSDLLVYGRLNAVTGQVISTRPPQTDGVDCDSVIIARDAWTRINPDGREDQVMLMLTAISAGDDAKTAPTELVQLNRTLLGEVGPYVPVSGVPLSVSSEVDVWIWRGGRTNLHPIPQFPNWDVVDELDGIPELIFSREGCQICAQTAGFAEDLWITGGSLRDDGGRKPFLRNFRTMDEDAVRDYDAPRCSNPDTVFACDPVPYWTNKCPAGGRDPTEEEIAAENGGVSKELALWFPASKRFRCGDDDACSRVGQFREWGRGLLPGDFDKVYGWALQLPTGSNRDVRARATHEATQDKGFAMRTLEIVRDMETGNSDDLPIRIDGTEYRMVIGVLDASGRVGSGSTEVRLEFAPPNPRPNPVWRDGDCPQLRR